MVELSLFDKSSEVSDDVFDFVLGVDTGALEEIELLSAAELLEYEIDTASEILWPSNLEVDWRDIVGGAS